MPIPTDKIPMLDAERKALEELYRLQVNSVRTLARVLGYPNPIADRRERPHRDVPDIDARGIVRAGDPDVTRH